MNALGRGQRERFRRCEVLRHRSTGGPRDEVPNYYACENRILEPSVKSRARKKYHLSAGTNTVKFVYLGAPVRREKSWCPRLKSGAHRARAIVVFSPAEEGAFLPGASPLITRISGALVFDSLYSIADSSARRVRGSPISSRPSSGWLH